jgi:hypothetical protein
MTQTLDIPRKIDFTESVEALSLKVNNDDSLRDTNCIAHSVGFVKEANQEFTAKMQEIGLKISLGFIFDLEYFDGTQRLGFHARNYVVAKCIQKPSNSAFIFADAFYGDTEFVKGSRVTDLLTSSEDPDNLIIYSQEGEGNCDDLVASSKQLRPAPFRLQRTAPRSVYLGESVGIEAIDHMADSLDGGIPIDKSKIPVLLVN